MPHTFVKTGGLTKGEVGLSLGVCAGLLVCALAGCGGGGNGGSGTAGATTGTGGSAGSGGGAVGPGTCVENPVFAARALGPDNDDIYRTIRFDGATQDMYLNDLTALFRVPRGGSEPQTIIDRTDGVSDHFWLQPDVFLLRGGFQGLFVSGVEAVLYTLPRTGTAGAVPQPVVIIPPKDDITQMYHDAFDVEVYGDEMYWVGNDGMVVPLGDPLRETFTIRTTSWKAPGVPRDLYTSSVFLDNPVLAAKRLYFSEGATPATEQQKVIDLQSAAAAPVPVPAALGGTVIAGDDDWLLVTRQDITDYPANYGMFRMRPDGSQSQQIALSPFPDTDVKNGTWALSGYDADANTFYVYTYVPATGAKKTVGCVNSTHTTVHAVALGPDGVYVSILRNGTDASILRYPL